MVRSAWPLVVAVGLVAGQSASLAAQSHQAGEAVILTVVVDRAPVLVAPVADAPVAVDVERGTTFQSEAEVNGEEIDGSVRWHLVTASHEPNLIRGFIHSSMVASNR
jgi:hypothetical protein